MKVVGFILISFFAFGQKSSFDQAKTEVVLRMIGHQLLLANHDSTSRVLPIKKLSDNRFQLRFNQHIAIQPDSLVSTVRKQMSENGISEAYIVEVKACLVHETVYSYAILKTQQTELVPCSGRTLPYNCYLIEIQFERALESPLVSTKSVLFLMGFFSLLAMGLLARKKLKKTPTKGIQMGKSLLDIENQSLLFAKETIPLTNKETKILAIFAKNPNVLIERERLQKEVWEDDGVIVGRSLDMYISKLRKKLSLDETLNLVNEHGKGYMLKILEAT